MRRNGEIMWTGVTALVTSIVIGCGVQAGTGHTDRILLRTKPSCSSADRDALLASFGGTIEREYRLVPGLVCVSTSGEVEHALACCQEQNELLIYAEAEQIAQPEAIPNDTLYFPWQYNLNNTGQTVVTDKIWIAGADINAEAGWEIATGDPNFVVAMIDTAIDITHPDLVGNVWTNIGETGLDAMGNDKATNGIDDDANGYIDDVNGWGFSKQRQQSR